MTWAMCTPRRPRPRDAPPGWKYPRTTSPQLEIGAPSPGTRTHSMRHRDPYMSALLIWCGEHQTHPPQGVPHMNMHETVMRNASRCADLVRVGGAHVLSRELLEQGYSDCWYAYGFA